MGSKSPGAAELVEEVAFDRFRRLVSVEAAVFDSELLCHRVGQFFHVVRHFSKSPDHRPKYPATLAVGVELRLLFPCIRSSRRCYFRVAHSVSTTNITSIQEGGEDERHTDN